MSTGPPLPPQQQPQPQPPLQQPPQVPQTSFTRQWNSLGIAGIPKLTAQDEDTFIRQLWPGAPPTFADRYDWNTYFTYYYGICADSMMENGRYSKARCHQDVLDIASYLRNGSDKASIRTVFSNIFQPTTIQAVRDRAMDGWIALASRAMVMIPIEQLGPPYSISAPHIEWNNGSLQDLLQAEFPRSTPSNPNIVFSAIFTAAMLTEYVRMEFEWTSNLHDHLRYSDDGTVRTVQVFRHATYLKHIGAHWNNNNLFPDGLIQETLDTLALLFPAGDKKTKNLLERHRKRYEYKPDHEVGNCEAPTSRDITHFRYWHARLAAIHDRMETFQPNSLLLLMRSPFQTKGTQWYAIVVALWVAVLFGFVQIFEGGWQAWSPKSN